jgi:hypothetical protein
MSEDVNPQPGDGDLVRTWWTCPDDPEWSVYRPTGENTGQEFNVVTVDVAREAVAAAVDAERARLEAKYTPVVEAAWWVWRDTTALRDWTPLVALELALRVAASTTPTDPERAT